MTRLCLRKSAPSGTAAGSAPSSAGTRSNAGKTKPSNSFAPSPGSMPALSRKSVLIGLLLIGVGALLGLVVASDLGWLPYGHAVHQPVVAVVPKPVALPLRGGSEQNFVEVAKAATPSVGNISTTRTNRSPEGHGFAPF